MLAREKGQRVMYVTERAVFELVPAGLEWIEVAPGVDVQNQILNRMEFQLIVRIVKPMSPDLFRPER